MLRHERLELPDELRVAAQLELAVDLLDLRGKPELAQACERVPFGSLEYDAGEWRPAPERERLSTQLNRLRQRGNAGGLEETLELDEIEQSRFEVEPVPGRLRLQNAVAELPAQRVHIPRDQLVRGRRWSLAPERVDETNRGHRLVGMHEQDAEQGALLGRAEAHHIRPPTNLEWTEDQELHRTAFAQETDRNTGLRAPFTMALTRCGVGGSRRGSSRGRGGLRGCRRAGRSGRAVA